jgi:hypothetical protein
VQKWIVTTAVASIFPVIVVLLATVRKPDTIAYHKAVCLKEYQRAEGTRMERLRSAILIGSGMAESEDQIFADTVKRYLEHRSALLRLAYLEERVFVTRPRSASTLAYHLRVAAKIYFDEEESLAFFDATARLRENDEVRVLCRKQDMPRVVAWMQRDYVPESGKREVEVREIVPKL